MLLSDFITAVQNSLAATPGDPWEDWQIEEWARMSIREISTTLHRTAVYPLTVASDQPATVDLNLLVRSVVNVRAAGINLTPRSRFDTQFDLGHHYHLETWDDGDTLPTLFLSAPASRLLPSGATLAITARIGHDANIHLHEDLTLPDHLIPLLEKGVHVQAYMHVMTDKATDLNLDERNWLRLAWQRVSEDYYRALKRSDTGESSQIIPWGL